MILKEIKLTIKKMPLLFVMLLLTQSLALAFILFYYGVYRNNKLELQRSYEEEAEIDVSGFPDDYTSGRVIREAFPELAEKLGSNFKGALISGLIRAKVDSFDEDDENIKITDENGKEFRAIRIGSSVYVKDGEYSNETGSLKDSTENGTWFTADMLKNGDKVCIVSASNVVRGRASLEINGEEYRVLDRITVAKMYNKIVVPAEALPDCLHGASLMIAFTHPLSASEYERCNRLISETFGVPDLRITDNASVSIDQKQAFLSMMLISVLFSMLAAVITGIIFHFLQKQREHDMAVFEINGASRKDIIRLYMSEMAVMLLMSAGLGILIFEKLLYAQNLKKFGWFEMVFSFRVKLGITAVYLMLSMAVVYVLVRKASLKTPKQLITERRLG